MADYTGKVTAYNGHPIYEGRPVGAFSDPVGTASDFVFNAGYDLVDMFNGLGTMGSAATARFWEGVPTPQNQWQMKPWIRPEQDFNTGLQMGKAIVDNYAHSYVDPVMQGRPMDIAKHFIAHPVNALLDVNGVAQLAGAPKLLNKAFQPKQAAQVAEAAQPMAQAAEEAQAAGGLGSLDEVMKARQGALDAAKVSANANAQADAAKAAQRVAMAKADAALHNSESAQAELDAALKAQADINAKLQSSAQAASDAQQAASDAKSVWQAAIDDANELKNKLLGNTPFSDEARQMASEFKKGVIAEDTNFLDDLGRLWYDVPKELRDQVQAYAEGWHPDLIAGRGMPDSVKAYLDKAEQYAAEMRKRIGHRVGVNDMVLDKYQPAALKLNGISTESWQSLSRPEQLDVLRFTRMQLREKGITPQYSPHVLQGEAGNTIRNPGTMQGFVSKGLDSDAGFLKTKQTAGEKAIKSHFDSMRTRWIQISQFQQAYEKILEKAIEVGELVDVLKNAPDAAANQLAKNAIEKLMQEQAAAEKLAANAAKDAQKANRAAKEAAKLVQENEQALKAASQEAAEAERLLKQMSAEADEAQKAAQQAKTEAKKAIRLSLEAKLDMLRKEEQAAKAEADLMAKLEEQAKKALDDSLKEGKGLEERMKAAGYVYVSGDKLVNAVLGPLKGAVISEEELAAIANKLMPEGVYLPKEFTKALEQAMKNNSMSGNWIVRAFDKASTINKRYQLGGNFLTYGLAQGVQGAFMLELVAMNGPKSAITSIISYGLALNKGIRKAVPLSIAEDVLASTVSTQRYLEQGVDALFNAPVIRNVPNAIQAPLRGAVGFYENVVDFGLKSGAVLDSMLRAKAGIQYALELAQENTPLGQAVREMFDTTYVLKAMGNTFADDAQKMAVARKVNDALGNFKEISEGAGMKAIGRLTPYPAWLGFITSYTAKLPVNHPYKALLLNNLAQLQYKYVAEPSVPSYLKGSVGISALGPNGLPQVVSKEGMNPLTSVPQLLQVMNTIMTGQGDDNAISLLTGPLQLGFMATTRLNPQTLQDFKDSSLYEVNGKQYTARDVEENNILEGTANPVRPLPDPLTLSLRTFFPVQERWLEGMAEKMYSGGKRTAMSSMFHSAPKRDKRTQEVQQAPDWITMFIQNLANVNPVEYDPSAEDRELQARAEAQKQLLKQYYSRP